jgi:3-oxosteroid 1-dehydrogenase
VIEGLYAIGNCSAPVTGTTYPASGATLGSAMVFGYIAGAEAANP